MWQAYLQDRISDAIGASVVFEKLSISPFRGIADGRGLVARVGDGATPFLTVGRVQLKLKMSDLLAKQLTIETVLLERPAVTIERGGDGTFNLPLWSKSSKPESPLPAVGEAESASSSSSWATGVKQIILTDGSATYRDHSAGFDGYTLEAKPINLQVDEPAGTTTLTGNVGSLRRTDKPADVGAMRVIGEGPDITALSDLSKLTGTLTVEVNDRLRIDASRRDGELLASVVIHMVIDELMRVLPDGWVDGVPEWARSMSSDVKLEVSWNQEHGLRLKSLAM